MGGRALLAVALAGVSLGGGAAFVTGAGRQPCASSGFFDNGGELGDGVFLAAIRHGCADRGRKRCTVADGTGPIATEVVEPGIRQDCAAFNQFVGAGLNQIPYYVTGECFGKALVGSDGVFKTRTVYSKFRCEL